MKKLERIALWTLVLILSYNVFINTEDIIMSKVKHSLGTLWDIVDEKDALQRERVDKIETRVLNMEYDRDHNIVPAHRHQSVVNVEVEVSELEHRISDIEDK